MKCSEYNYVSRLLGCAHITGGNMDFSYEQLIQFTGAVPLVKNNTEGRFSVSTDTRTITETNIYLPLRGETFDGERFTTKALDSGARCYFTSNPENIIEEADFGLFTEDTKIAYLKLANAYKKMVSPTTIAITGSSGKTTTKEIFSAVFSANCRTHKSKLNHNNEIGLCQTLLSMPEDTEVLIVEMGMRGLGEIELLSEYSEPDIAVITNIGTAHIGRLGSRENIARAKCEIAKHLAPKGVLITFEDEFYDKILSEQKYSGKHQVINLKEPHYKSIWMKKEASEFIYEGVVYNLPAGGEYNVHDTLLCIQAAISYGLTDAQIQNGLDTYRPIEKRFEEIEVNGIKIINDSYNANPDSMKAAITAFLGLYDGDKYLVLADMMELGENEVKYHKELGAFLNRFENLTLITIGGLSKNISDECSHPSHNFSSNIEAAEFLKHEAKKNSTILLKGSRSMKLEEIIEEMKK